MFALEKCLNLQGYYQTLSPMLWTSLHFFGFSKWNVRNELSRWHVDTDAILVFPGRVTNFSVLRHFHKEILKMLKLFIVRVHGDHSWKQSMCGTLRYSSLKYIYLNRLSFHLIWTLSSHIPRLMENSTSGILGAPTPWKERGSVEWSLEEASLLLIFTLVSRSTSPTASVSLLGQSEVGNLSAQDFV